MAEPCGETFGSSCGYFGDQGGERRKSHSRSVSPWLCHPSSTSHTPARGRVGIWLPLSPSPFSLCGVCHPCGPIDHSKAFRGALLPDFSSCSKSAWSGPGEGEETEIWDNRSSLGELVCAFKGKTVHGGGGNMRSSFHFRASSPPEPQARFGDALVSLGNHPGHSLIPTLPWVPPFPSWKSLEYFNQSQGDPRRFQGRKKLWR